MIPVRVFSMNQSVVQAIHSEGRGGIPMSVACFNYSIAEVWTANTCLTTACFANNGTVAGVKSKRRIITVLLSITDDTNNTRRTLYFSQIIRPQLVVVPREKTCVRRTRLWEFLGVRTLSYASREAGFCVPKNPARLPAGVILELSGREKFCNNFREKFWFKFWFSLYILYIFTSPSAQDREKSASLGRLFLPNGPLGWPLVPARMHSWAWGSMKRKKETNLAC